MPHRVACGKVAAVEELTDASAAAAAGHPTPVSKTDEADPAAEGRPSRSAAELKDAAAAGGKESCGEQAKHSATSKEQAQKKRSARSEPKRQEEAVPVPPKTGNLQAWRQALSTRELQVLYKDMFGVATKSIKLPPNGSSRGAEIKPKAENDLPSPYKFKSLKSKWLSAYQEECREAATDGLSPSSSAHGQFTIRLPPWDLVRAEGA
eukprot:gene13974-16517_t